MRFPRRRTALLTLLMILLVAAGLLLWRRSTPPLVARILPESQGIIYFDLSPLRAATHFDRRPVPHDPDYQGFINATGINFERDLNEAAFALDHLPDSTGPNGGLAFSEVFAGRFDAKRLAAYLGTISASQEQYAGRTIYNVASDGRTVRVAILPGGMVAVSNTPTPEQIHSILDRNRTAWLPFGGSEPTVLREYYRDVPALSLAWGLGQIGLPFGDHGEFRIMGFTLPFRLDSIFVASLRWTGAVRLRVEEIAPDEMAAEASAKALKGVVAVSRFAENNLPGVLSNADAQAFFNSARVLTYNNRAVLTATVPDNLLHSLVASPDKLAPAQKH